MASTVAMKSPKLLLIDEPESHLHPSLQAKFLTAMTSYADYGVFFATHSLASRDPPQKKSTRSRRALRAAFFSLWSLLPNSPNYSASSAIPAIGSSASTASSSSKDQLR